MEAGFDNAAKRLHPYLRALWGRELRLHPYDRPAQQQRPYLSELGIHLPLSWHAGQGEQAFTLYRAATHAAAHLAYSHHRFERRSLKPVQLVLISLLELIRAHRIRQPARLRRQPDGERFDLDALADAAIALSRLAAVRGAQSTRIGTALRHATRRLADDPGSRGNQQLILVVTDGEPHDIDIFHPGYLARDAQHAVREAISAGVHVFCVAVDRQADEYVRTIFGENNYLAMDAVADLPEKLPGLYLRLTR